VIYAVVHGVIALVCLGWALATLRPLSEPLPGGPVPAGLPPEPDRAARPGRPGPHEEPTPEAVILYLASPPIGDDALYWKETLQGTGPVALTHPLHWLAKHRRPVMLIGLSISLLFIFQYLGDPDGMRAFLQVWSMFIRGGGALFVVGWCVGAAFRAAGSVSREREKRTLDGLLTLPLERAEILRAKGAGSVLRGLFCAYILLVLSAVGLFSGALHPLALPLLAVAGLVHVAFWASLGVWLSLACRTTSAAYVSAALALLLLFAGPWLGVVLSGGLSGEQDLAADLFLLGLNPLRTWWFLAFSWPDFWDAAVGTDPSFLSRVGAVLIGLTAYAAAAWLLWGSACRKFSRDPQGSAGARSPAGRG
jgi:ABC-type transport system involved in multi-copper enzyme maturation permease subunit